jgi:hypothetical protein
MLWSNYIEVLLVAYISLVGLLTLRPTAGSGLNNNYLFMLSFPLGYSYLVIAAIVSFYLFSRFNVIFTLLAPLIVLLMIWLRAESGLIGKIRWFCIIKIVFYYILLAFILRWLNIVVFTCDSIVFMGIASSFADALQIQVFVKNLLSYPIFIIPMHAMVKYFGQDYCSSFSPIFSICTIFAVIFHTKKHICDSEIILSPYTRLVFLVTGFFFLTTYFIMQQIFYVNGHTAAACIMTILALEIINTKNVESSSATLSNFKAFIIFSLLSAQIFVRIEGILMAEIFLILLTEFRMLTNRQMIIGSGFLCFLSGIWIFSIFNTEIQVTGHVNLIKMTTLLSPIIFLVILYSSSKLKVHIKYLRPLLIIALLLGLLFYAFSKPENFAVSNVNIISNLLIGTPWGLLWSILLVFSLFIWQSKQSNKDKLIIYFIVTYFAIVVMLGYFRHPYRNNWKDSANRVFLHIIPLVSYLMMTKVGCTLSRTLCKFEINSK